MAESGPAKSQPSSAGKSSTTRHLGNETDWYIFSTQPDYCAVGNSVVGFDSYAVLTNKATASPNVKAQFNAKPLYRVSDKVSGVLANAGAGVCSSTSLKAGHAIFLDGQFNVKANGLMTVMDGTRCMINCNAAGIGNATAVLRTEVKTASSAPPPRGVLARMADESGNTLTKKWKELKGQAGTVWEALPWTSDEAVTAAARNKISEGALNTLKGLATLAGPPPEYVDYAYRSGDPTAIAAVQAMQQEQQMAVGGIVDGVKKSWNEAEGRNGTAGAISGVLTGLGADALGTKGVGVIAKAAVKVTGIGKVAGAAEVAGNVPQTPGGSGHIPSVPDNAGHIPAAPGGAGHAPVSGQVDTPSAPVSNGGAAAPSSVNSSAAVVAPGSARVNDAVTNATANAKSKLEEAALLDRDIARGKSEGWTKEEIAQLEQARKDRLAEARKEAAADKSGGVHVKRGRLKPNSSYELNGYRYTTDEAGRIKTVEGDLRLASGTRDEYAQRTVGAGDGRLANDQGGHLIGSQFDGYGGRENLTPMAKDINNYHSGEWGMMEKNWAERLRAGDTVNVQISPVYVGDTIRAGSFRITETINGIASNRVILNPG